MRNTARFLFVLFLFFFVFFSICHGQMVIHHINVGQGDATLLEFKSAAVLIDAGGSHIDTSNSRQNHFFDYLDKFFTRRSDLHNTLYSVIITHPHEDHNKYLLQLMEKYHINNLVDNGDRRNKWNVDDQMKARDIVRTYTLQNPPTGFYNQVDGTEIGHTGYTPPYLGFLKVLPNEAEFIILNASRNCSTPNNDSLVVLVKYKNIKALITGDAEWKEASPGCNPAILRMLANNPNLLNIDVYKVGHHGADNGTNPAYLARMTPKISVISAGDRNDLNAKGYGHPRIAIINELEHFPGMDSRTAINSFGREEANGDAVSIDISKAVYCTCWDGDIVISTNAAGTKLLPVKTIP